MIDIITESKPRLLTIEKAVGLIDDLAVNGLRTLCESGQMPYILMLIMPMTCNLKF